MKRYLFSFLAVLALGAWADVPSLTSVTARQRYPWNGLVDIDVAFTGAADSAYAVELTATDVVGGTNLPLAAVSGPASPKPGTNRFVWNADADLPDGFESDRVTVTAKLLNPIWQFDGIPAIDPDDEWAPETVYHDIQTVVSYGEIENPTPTIRCLNDAWNLDAKLGPNVRFSGASMLVRDPTDNNLMGLGATNAVSVLAMSDTTNEFRIVTLDYETGSLGYDVPYPSDGSTAEGYFFSIKNDPRVYLDMYRGTNSYVAFVKNAGADASMVHLGNRHDGLYFGSSVCGYFPNGIPFTDASATTYPSSYDKNTHAAIFHAGVAGTDVRQTIVKIVDSAPKGVVTNSLYSFGKNMIGRYVVPLIDGDTYFTVNFGIDPGNVGDVWHYGGIYGKFSQMNDELFDTRDDKIPYVAGEWVRSAGTSYSKGVAMPDGRRIFLGGTGHDMDGTLMMWYAGTNLYSGPAKSSYNPEIYGSHKNGRVFDTYPSNHVFSAWNRRDVTCLLPNGKFCGVDEKLGLVVVNPLTGETYVASDDPVFKKGQMGCQLLPNGKVLIVPYDCENELLAPRIGLDRARAASACGKLYEVDFGFTRSFSVSTLRSPYVRVAECPPEPSGVKVGLHPNGGKLPGIYCQYYPQENPAYGTLPTPTRTGYAFLGWGTATNSTTFVKATDPVPSTGIVLYAGWQANAYTVKFNANGGTGTMANESFTYGTSKALTANAFTRTGYSFQGWATSASGAKTYSDKQSVNNLTATAGGTYNLYAKWTALTAATATYLVIDLSGGTNATSYPVTYLDAPPSGGFNTDIYKTSKLVMRKCKAGTFVMGSPTNELGRANNETQHKVTLTKDFYIGLFEVSQMQFKNIMGYNPVEEDNSIYRGNSKPVHINYNAIRGSNLGAKWPATNTVDTSSFVGILRTKAALQNIDLPTEAQWEYACRAGTTTALNSGKNLTSSYSCKNLGVLGRYMYNGGFTNTDGTSDSITDVTYAKCGTYIPNNWGIYDMHGNAKEWCLDWYAGFSSSAQTDPKGNSSGSNRVLKGGHYGREAEFCRSAARDSLKPSMSYLGFGFRLALHLP